MRRGDERGQSTVEFALIIPLVFVALLVVVQVALVAHAQLTVTHLARETARAIAADPSTDVGLLIQDRTPLGTDDLSIEVLFEPSPVLGRDFVVVVVSYETARISGLFDPFTPQLKVRSQVKMLMES